MAGSIRSPAGRLTQIAAPAGLEIPGSRTSLRCQALILWLLGLLFGATASYFLFTLFGYVLSGAAMFLLTRRFTESTWIALIAGWAFAFFPFAVLGGTQHPQFVHSWLFVLLAWRMLVLSERPTVRNGILLGGATALTFFWTPYFVLLGAVLYAMLALCSIGFAARGGRMRAQLPAHAVGAAISLAALIAVALLATHGTDRHGHSCQQHQPARSVLGARAGVRRTAVEQLAGGRSDGPVSPSDGSTAPTPKRRRSTSGSRSCCSPPPQPSRRCAAGWRPSRPRSSSARCC